MSVDKSALREIARQRLQANAPFRDAKSTAIWNTLVQRTEFEDARKNGQLMVYLDFGDEVQTEKFLRRYSFSQNGIIIPLCQSGEIVAVKIFSWDEMEPGIFGILEPKKKVVTHPKHIVPLNEIRFVLVPGLAFDRQGNRLGRGKGYYDRFLKKLPQGAVTVGLAFECQIFENVLVDSNDLPVQQVITENG